MSVSVGAREQREEAFDHASGLLEAAFDAP